MQISPETTAEAGRLTTVSAASLWLMHRIGAVLLPKGGTLAAV